MSYNTKNGKQAIKYLVSSKEIILKYLQQVIKSKKFNYRTFGTDIEEPLSDIITQVFTKGGFIKSKNDYVLAPNKNYFPDFQLKTAPPIAIEYKSGNRSQFKKGKWVSVKNSQNDMGTLNVWPQKINKFGGENIYYIFVVYNFNAARNDILSIDIAPFYQFLAHNSGKVLRYREKDGNLRPKDFDAVPTIKTFAQFMSLLNKTDIYRSKRIIKRHRSIIKKANDAIKRGLG